MHVNFTTQMPILLCMEESIIALFAAHLQSINIVLWVGTGVVVIIMLLGQFILKRMQDSKIQEIINTTVFEKHLEPLIEKYLSREEVLDKLRQQTTIKSSTTKGRSDFEDDIPF